MEYANKKSRKTIISYRISKEINHETSISRRRRQVKINVNYFSFFILVENIEKNQKVAIVHLTDDPDTSVEACGYNCEQYEMGLSTVEKVRISIRIEDKAETEKRGQKVRDRNPKWAKKICIS